MLGESDVVCSWELMGDEWRAREGKGDVLVEEELYDILPPDRALLHRGEIVVGFLPSALRGCSRSGDSARRKSGEPAELGSPDLGREKDFLLGVRLRLLPPGEKVCVALEEPG